MLLDYEDHESIRRSIYSAFCICEGEVDSTIRSIGSGHSISNSLDELLLSSFCQSLGRPCGDVFATWFHGTRAIDAQSFLALGILPKSEIKSHVHEVILSLSKGISKDGENPFSLSMSGKVGAHDEGPFASLFKEAVVRPARGYHNYLEVPELIEDFAGEMFGKNYVELVGRYKKKTRPYCIYFRAPAAIEQLGRGLRYVYLVLNGYSCNEAANLSNMFFSSKGVAIMPHEITKIELVEG